MYFLCIQLGRCIFHCIESTEKLSKLETIVFCLPLYITCPSVIERLSTATFAIFLKITFKPTISIRQTFEVLKQPLGPQWSVSWGNVRSLNVRVSSETYSRNFSITILINAFLTNVPILYLQGAPENLSSQGL